MSVAIKWVLLAGLLAVVLASFASVVGLLPFSEITVGLSTAWAAVSSYVIAPARAVRGFLNWLYGSPMVVGLLIKACLLMPVVAIGFKFTARIIRHFSN